jgi:hypothetical protein
VIATTVVVGLAGVSLAASSGGPHSRAPDRTSTLLGHPRNVDAANWAEIQAAAWLRQNALSPKRTPFHRRFAAYMGLSTLLQLHFPLRSRCAVAVSYLYDNLLDLHEAYTGEDWTPLRQAVAGEPSLAACAPVHVVFVE